MSAECVLTEINSTADAMWKLSVYTFTGHLGLRTVHRLDYFPRGVVVVWSFVSIPLGKLGTPMIKSNYELSWPWTTDSYFLLSTYYIRAIKLHKHMTCICERDVRGWTDGAIKKTLNLKSKTKNLKQSNTTRFTYTKRYICFELTRLQATQAVCKNDDGEKETIYPIIAMDWPSRA